MNILYVAPSSSFTLQTHAALQTLGHKVYYLDDRADYSLPEALRRFRIIWRAGRRIPWWRDRTNRALQDAVLKPSDEYELLLAGKGMNIRAETLAELHGRGVRTAVWFPDNGANEPYASWIREVGPMWDRFYSFDSAIVEQLPEPANHGILPFGVDTKTWEPGILTESDRATYTCDVAFIGAPYPERIRLLLRIAGTCDLRIWGWSEWSTTPLAMYYRGPLNTSESAKVYRLAKISVNTNILPHARGVNLKTFEICAAGGFQLSDVCADLGTSYVVGKELDTFISDEEFESKVRYWCSHENERESVARAGRERTLRDHTLVKRCTELIEGIKQ